MAMYRNVTPLLMPNFDDRDRRSRTPSGCSSSAACSSPATPTASPAASRWAIPGGTNMLKVGRVGG